MQEKIYEDTKNKGKLICYISEKKLPTCNGYVQLVSNDRAVIRETLGDRLAAFFTFNPIAFIENMCKKANEIVRIDSVLQKTK